MSIDDLLKRISAHYDDLSAKLQLVARYIEQHHEHLGIEGIQEMAAKCQVQPSSIVRFAKYFGLSGFSEMQQILRDGLTRKFAPNHPYGKRLRKVIDTQAQPRAETDIAKELIENSINGLQSLVSRFDLGNFKAAINLLLNADVIWLVGSRRSFPVAAYLDYALQRTGKRVILVSALGSMQQEQIRAARRGDVVLAIAFRPYADETLKVAQQARKQGAKLIAITDSRLASFGRDANVTLLVQEEAHLGFRSLSSTMALAEGLAIALAYRLELTHGPVKPAIAKGGKKKRRS
jgi:DNA-binding MurR/RpiR family transcriptional regulator